MGTFIDTKKTIAMMTMHCPHGNNDNRGNDFFAITILGSRNPLVCDCHASWLKQSLTVQKVKKG